MRVERDQADELRPGITAGACDGNPDSSHGSLCCSVVIAVDIKKGKAGRLPFFVMRLRRLIVWSIGTAFWRPSGHTSCALSLVSRGSATLLSLMGRGVAGSSSPKPGRWRDATRRLALSVP